LIAAEIRSWQISAKKIRRLEKHPPYIAEDLSATEQDILVQSAENAVSQCQCKYFCGSVIFLPPLSVSFVTGVPLSEKQTPSARWPLVGFLVGW
jgi:hypothetical protein